MLVNNFHYLDDLYRNKTDNDDSILSVTVVKKHKLSESDLIKQIKLELQQHCKIETGALLKMFHIKKALPKITNLKYQTPEASAMLYPGVYCCGDYLANGSLNAAMASGRLVAALLAKNEIQR